MGLLWELATQIADFRAGNGLPNATAKEVVHEIEEQTCARLHDDPAHCSQKKTTGARPAHVPRSKSANLAGGVRTLVEWLGTGAETVDISIAQARANVCLGCPENREGHRWLKLSADAVRAIAEQMQAKDAMKLRVIDEEKLHACARCLCPLPLKVWVPISTISHGTDDETLNSFPPFCWVKNEIYAARNRSQETV